MARQRNTNVRGQPFDAATVKAVWDKLPLQPERPDGSSKKDVCGTWIQRSAHGTTGTYGWEVDHIKPVAKGGTDDLNNLQALQWETNRKKGDTYPWSCS